MNKNLFKMKTPCSNCPFRSDDKSIELVDGRREEIINGLLRQTESVFHCHKTVHKKGAENFDDDGNFQPNDVTVCPGAVAVCRKIGRDMQIVQIATRLQVIPENHYNGAMESTLNEEDLDIDRKSVHL